MTTTFMLSMQLRARQLYSPQRIPPQADDLGYLAHAQLAALFGTRAPAPFAIVGHTAETVQLLGYSISPSATLAEYARTFAEPRDYAACVWDQFAGKPMPEEWCTGTRYSFRVRLCPTIRAAAGGEHHRKGAERDAFLAAVTRTEPDASISREDVYREWLATRLAPLGATLESARMSSFRLARLVRKTQGSDRKSRVLERPDTVFEGNLIVRDGDLFQAAIRRGVGRHRAFGFGMLLMRPPDG